MEMHKTHRDRIIITILKVALVLLLFYIFTIGLPQASANLYMSYYPNSTKPCGFGITGWETTWILWSNPLVGSNTTARQLMESSNATGIIVISNLNASEIKYHSYIIGAPERYNFKLEDGKGYWVWTTTCNWISTTGWPTNDSLHVMVYKGWNLLGVCTWNHTAKWSLYIMASEFLAKNTYLTVISSMYYDGGMGDHTPVWVSFIKHSTPARYDFRCWIGTGVYVWADANCTISW
jgi:hypothetical protein